MREKREGKILPRTTRTKEEEHRTELTEGTEEHGGELKHEPLRCPTCGVRARRSKDP